MIIDDKSLLSCCREQDCQYLSDLAQREAVTLSKYCLELVNLVANVFLVLEAAYS